MSHTTVCYMANKKLCEKKCQVKSATLPATQVFSSATFIKSKTFWWWNEKAQGKPLISDKLTNTHICSLANKSLFTKSDCVNWPFSVLFCFFFFTFGSAFASKQTPFNDHLRSRMVSSEASHQGLPSLVVHSKQGCYVYNLHCWD